MRLAGITRYWRCKQVVGRVHRGFQ
jgi:hypothetical protein